MLALPCSCLLMWVLLIQFVEYSYRPKKLGYAKRRKNSMSAILLILVRSSAFLAPGRATPGRPSSNPAAGQVMARRSALGVC